MGIAERLDTALRDAGIAIVGVSIGIAGDKSTWRVDFTGKADAAAQDSAKSVIAGFDANAPDVAVVSPTKALADLLVSKSVITANDAAGIV